MPGGISIGEIREKNEIRAKNEGHFAHIEVQECRRLFESDSSKQCIEAGIVAEAFEFGCDL